MMPAGLVMLEVSVVVFLLQGYLTSGREVMHFQADPQMLVLFLPQQLLMQSDIICLDACQAIKV